MKILWTETAKNDLVAIRRFIAMDNHTAATKWTERLRTKASGIAHAPLAGRKVPELSRDDIREVIVKNYRIVYQVHSDHTLILTVFESHLLLSNSNLDEDAL